MCLSAQLYASGEMANKAMCVAGLVYEYLRGKYVRQYSWEEWVWESLGLNTFLLECSKLIKENWVCLLVFDLRAFPNVCFSAQQLLGNKTVNMGQGEEKGGKEDGVHVITKHRGSRKNIFLGQIISCIQL